MARKPLVLAVLRCRMGPRRVDPLTGQVDADPPLGGADPVELGVLEHALLLSRALGAFCVAVSSGPEQADELLREALGAGADAALRLDDPAPSPADLWRDGSALADRLLAAVGDRHGRPDLVLCAHHPRDEDASTLPAFLAARLGAAQALGLLAVDAVAVDVLEAGAARDDSPGTLRGSRRLDGGLRERLLIPLPAVCSVEPGSATPRRASLPAILEARGRTIPVASRRAWPAADVGRVQVGPPRPGRPAAQPAAYPDGDAHDRLAALSGSGRPSAGPRLVTPSDPTEAAAELLNYLERHDLLGAVAVRTPDRTSVRTPVRTPAPAAGDGG